MQDSLRSGVATQPVIITVAAGHRAEIRAALEQHGDRIRADHPLLDALSVELHTADITELDGEYLDQSLWTIIGEDWLQSKAAWGSPIVH